MSTHNIGFYEDLTKNFFELSSNTHLISSAEESDYSESNINHCLVLLFIRTTVTFFFKHRKIPFTINLL